MMVFPGQEKRKKSRGWTRMKSGCFTCRKRRKRCDEIRPICIGCERNHLICQWPSAKHTGHASENGEADVSQKTSSSYEFSPRDNPPAYGINHPFMRSIRSVQVLPPVFKGNTYLLDHYSSFTAKRMAGKEVLENPFLSYNMQIALENELMQHAIIAISSSHLLYSDSRQAAISQAHYAIVLRGIKHAVTRWRTFTKREKYGLLAVVLAVCWFEVIDVNMDGALYHHLRASGIILSNLQEHCTTHTENMLGFLAEQYAYLVLVSNISFWPQYTDRWLSPRLPYASLEAINAGTPIHGCLFGHSHQLYESITLISDLANRRKLEGPQPSHSSVASLHSLTSRVLNWQSKAGTLDNEAQAAGYMYQAACMVFLQTSFHGPYPQTEKLYASISPHISFFLESFGQLSYEAAAWTTISWPSLIVGSCMRVSPQRDQLSKIIHNSTIKMRAIQQIVSTLSLVWTEMDIDGTIYGPYGLEKVLEMYKISLCIG